MRDGEADSQREAVEYARLRQLVDGDEGCVHVMGPKLFGPVLMRERECTSAEPFAAGEMPERVVYHPEARALPWGGFFCAACGEATGARERGEG